MIDELVAVSQELPALLIDRIEYSDPMAVLAGEGWWLSAACPWRLTRDGALVCAYGSTGAEPVLRTLAGEQITAIARQASAGPSEDPGVHITGGYYLELFSDTDLDPWVFRLADRTFVGLASAP